MALSSMTGFARVDGRDDRGTWAWEARSVNSRGLDFRTRLPAGLDQLDMRLREAVKGRFKRGAVTLTLTVESVEGDSGLALNRRWLADLAEQAQALAVAYDVQPARADGLLGLRGVIEPRTTPAAGLAGREAALLATAAEALESMAQARAGEGAALRMALDQLLTRIAGLVEEAAGMAVNQPARIKARLERQLADLAPAAEVGEERLAQEVALLAAKADVNEELDRLAAHVDEAVRLIDGKEPVGRRLDFLCQEFNREANTLCSKSADIEMTRVGLDLKTAIDQFREQVQNIE